MKGVSYVTDEKGKRIAVQIDLKKYGRIWEDFYDALIVAEKRMNPSFPGVKQKASCEKRNEAVRNYHSKIRFETLLCSLAD